jgi:hypothetical protein
MSWSTVLNTALGSVLRKPVPRGHTKHGIIQKQKVLITIWETLRYLDEIAPEKLPLVGDLATVHRHRVWLGRALVHDDDLRTQWTK